MCTRVTLKVVSTKNKTMHLLFEVMHDVEGGRTRAMCLDCENITLEVEGDADRLAFCVSL